MTWWPGMVWFGCKGDSETPPPMGSLALLEVVNEAWKVGGENYEIFVVRNFNNTETEAFRLDRDQCVLVSMRESKSVRRQVLARLKEMESGISFRIPQSLPEALRLAAEQVEQLGTEPNSGLSEYKARPGAQRLVASGVNRGDAPLAHT